MGAGPPHSSLNQALCCPWILHQHQQQFPDAPRVRGEERRVVRGAAAQHGRVHLRLPVEPFQQEDQELVVLGHRRQGHLRAAASAEERCGGVSLHRRTSPCCTLKLSDLSARHRTDSTAEPAVLCERIERTTVAGMAARVGAGLA